MRLIVGLFLAGAVFGADLVELGDAAARSRQWEAALGYYAKALPARGVERSVVAAKIAIVERSRGRVAEAIYWFGEAEKAAPRPSASLMVQRAMLLDGVGRSTEAAAAYEQVLRLDSDNVVALNNLAMLVSGRDRARAVRLAKRAVELAPGDRAVQDTLRRVTQ